MICMIGVAVNIVNVLLHCTDVSLLCVLNGCSYDRSLFQSSALLHSHAASRCLHLVMVIAFLYFLDFRIDLN